MVYLIGISFFFTLNLPYMTYRKNPNFPNVNDKEREIYGQI